MDGAAVPPQPQWQQLAEHTVADLTSTPVEQLTDDLVDLAASLNTAGSAGNGPAPLPRHIA